MEYDASINENDSLPHSTNTYIYYVFKIKE